MIFLTEEQQKLIEEAELNTNFRTIPSYIVTDLLQIIALKGKVIEKLVQQRDSGIDYFVSKNPKAKKEQHIAWYDNQIRIIVEELNSEGT